MLCPSVSDSVVLGINALSTDEEIVLFLGALRVGDPIPATVITEVNPFSIEPWNSPENILYLYNLDDGQRKKGSNEIREAKDGYWKTMGEVSKISTGSDMMGRKTALEFYIGSPPFGDKTCWMMHEYQTEWKIHQGIRIAQEYSSLCKVFWQSDRRPEHEEPHSFVGLDCMDDADADAEYLEAMLLFLLEEDEGNLSPHYDANSTQAVNGEDQRNAATSDNTMVDKDANLDFINEEYIELNDIDPAESSSSSSSSSSNSCNSSLMAMDSNEYFDADALLNELTNDKDANCRFNISASAKSNRIIIRPSPSGSIISGNNNKEPPKSPSIRRSSGKSGAVGRISKLGKRYCCIASF